MQRTHVHETSLKLLAVSDSLVLIMITKWEMVIEISCSQWKVNQSLLQVKKSLPLCAIVTHSLLTISPVSFKSFVAATLSIIGCFVTNKFTKISLSLTQKKIAYLYIMKVRHTLSLSRWPEVLGYLLANFSNSNFGQQTQDFYVKYNLFMFIFLFPQLSLCVWHYLRSALLLYFSSQTEKHVSNSMYVSHINDWLHSKHVYNVLEKVTNEWCLHNS